MGERQERWILIGGMSLARRVFVYWAPAVALALLLSLVWPLTLDIRSDGHGPQHTTWISSVLTVVWVVQIPGVFFRQRRTPFVKMVARRIRVKGLRTRFSDIDTVMVEGWRDGGSTHVYMQFGKIGKELAKVRLRSPSRRVIGDDDRNIIAEILRQSNVRLPERPGPDSTDWDRVNWVNRPHYLDREEAIAYVLHTPAPGERFERPTAAQVPTPA